MTPPDEPISRRLWLCGIGLAAALLAAGLALIVALALGWNSSRPTRPADWQASGLPRLLEAGPGETVALMLSHPSDDFVFEVEAGPLADSGFNGYGLAYRAQDPSHSYVFAVDGDGYYAVLRRDGNETTPLVDWQQFPHIRRGLHANRLTVTCSGTTCQFAINDELAATVEDSRWTRGDVGLWVEALDETTNVRFTRARLWESRDP